ncbi:unnamed protein product [Sphagnum tenellum]
MHQLMQPELQSSDVIRTPLPGRQPAAHPHQQLQRANDSRNSHLNLAIINDTNANNTTNANHHYNNHSNNRLNLSTVHAPRRDDPAHTSTRLLAGRVPGRGQLSLPLPPAGQNAPVGPAEVRPQASAASAVQSGRLRGQAAVRRRAREERGRLQPEPAAQPGRARGRLHHQEAARAGAGRPSWR